MIRRPNGVYFVFAFAFAFALVAATPSTAQTVVHVDADAAPGGDGSSWSKALADLQGALAAASGGTVDEIWVAEGTYRPDSGSGSRTAAFIVPPGVDLYGGFVGTEIDRSKSDPVAHPTILSGDLLGDDGPDFANASENSHHVVVFGDTSGGQGLDGFVIRGGNADGAVAEDRVGGGLSLAPSAVLTVTRCVLEANQATGDGGAVHVAIGSSSEFDGCTFTENRSGADGGAVHASFGGLRISGSTLSKNEAQGDGGGFHCVDGRLDIADSRFEGNRAGGSGGGGFFSQLEAFSSYGISMVDCVFEGNECALQGGGMAGRRDGSAFHPPTWRIQGCSFVRNRSTDVASSRGGGLDVSPTAHGSYVDLLQFAGCEFIENKTAGSGGGIAFERVYNAEFGEVRIEGNVAAGEGGGIFSSEGGYLDFVTGRIIDNESSRGGGVGSDGGSLYFANSLLAGNRATGNYGAVYAYGRTMIWGCTIAANHAGGAVGGVRCYRTTQKNGHAVDSIFWGNSDKSGTVQVSQLNGFEDANRCCIQGWDDTIDGDHSFDADPLFVDAANGNYRLGPGSPCIEAGDPALLHAGPDLDGYSAITDGDFDRILVDDLGVFEYSHVDLAATASTAPGGKVTIDTTGTAGLPVFLIFGLEQEWLFLPHVGSLGVELGSICACLPWPPAPSSVALDVPNDAPVVDVWVQQIAFSGAAANFSNLVKIEVR